MHRGGIDERIGIRVQQGIAIVRDDGFEQPGLDVLQLDVVRTRRHAEIVDDSLLLE